MQLECWMQIEFFSLTGWLQVLQRASCQRIYVRPNSISRHRAKHNLWSMNREWEGGGCIVPEYDTDCRLMFLERNGCDSWDMNRGHSHHKPNHHCRSLRLSVCALVSSCRSYSAIDAGLNQGLGPSIGVCSEPTNQPTTGAFRFVCLSTAASIPLT